MGETGHVATVHVVVVLEPLTRYGKLVVRMLLPQALVGAAIQLVLQVKC